MLKRFLNMQGLVPGLYMISAMLGDTRESGLYSAVGAPPSIFN